MLPLRQTSPKSCRGELRRRRRPSPLTASRLVVLLSLAAMLSASSCFGSGGGAAVATAKILPDNRLWDNLLRIATAVQQQRRAEGDGEVASDGAATEETDVQEAVQEMMEEAEEEKEEEARALDGQQLTGKASAEASSGTAAPQANSHRGAWVAHGVVAAVVMGFLIPVAVASALFRDLIPTYWIYIHVCVNVIVFAMTFFAVGIAFATMNGMGAAGGGHMKEVHHIVGLLVLLLVSFQTANGFLRPPREFYTDDENDTTPGAILRSEAGNGLTARTLWYLAHSASGLVVFVLGTYQVHSGLGLFSKRYGGPHLGEAYVWYAVWLLVVAAIGKGTMKWRELRAKRASNEVQMKGGKNNITSSKV